MNSTILSNGLRFFFLALFQVLILRQVAEEFLYFPYVNILIYPLFIILMPLWTPRVLQFLLAFLLGICIDYFYDTLGIHTSALVFTTYVRHYVLRLLEPRGGYNVNFGPNRSRLGFPWFLRYSGILVFLHCFFYFSVEAFTFVYILDILLKTVLGFVFTMIVLIALTFIFEPRD